MNALILSDGRLGHLNQSIAFAKHLQLDFIVININFKYRFYKPLSYIFDFLKIYTFRLFVADSYEIKNVNLVISSGSTTYYANKVFSRHFSLKSIVMMLPQSYRYDFDIIFAQNHDHPPRQANIITIPANFSYVQPKGIFAPKTKSIGVIIGGNNAHFKMDKERIKHQLASIFETYKGYEIAVTTSPRTPKEIEKIIESYPFAYSVIFSNNKINPIADFLEHCEVVFITIDSTSMISEAISYGFSYIEILPLSENVNNKFYAFVQNLANEGYVHLYDGSLGHKNKKIDFKHYAQKALE